MANMGVVRGLDVRCAYARGLVLAQVHGDAAEVVQEVMDAVGGRAEEMGRFDFAAGNADAPILFRDAPGLLTRWIVGYEGLVTDTPAALKPTLSCACADDARPYDYLKLIEKAEKEAASGCGCCDVLYEKEVQAAYAQILENAPEHLKALVKSVLKGRGYSEDFEPYVAGPGECSLTGIDTYCCPCGRHP